MGQGEAYLQPGKREEEEGRGNGRTVEGARKRGRWEWSILHNSRILLAGILGSSLHKDHSLPLPLLQCTRSCTDVLSFYFSPLLSLPMFFSLFIVRSSFTFFATFRRYIFPCSFLHRFPLLSDGHLCDALPALRDPPHRPCDSSVSFRPRALLVYFTKWSCIGSDIT